MTGINLFHCPLLQILIAHYTEPQSVVERMLLSINNQNVNMREIEVIILNDGTSVLLDEEIFKKYKYKINYQISEKVGTSKIRNKLINFATAPFIWFLDSDDEIFPNTINEILNTIKQNDIDFLTISSMWEQKNKSNQIHDLYFNPAMHQHSIVGCNIFKKQFLIDNNIFCDENSSLAGDLILEEIPRYYTNKKWCITTPILHYLYNSTSVVHCMNTNGWKQQRECVMITIINRLLNDNKYREAYSEYSNFVINYNSKKVHDYFEQEFKKLQLYKLNYKKDLR